MPPNPKPTVGDSEWASNTGTAVIANILAGMKAVGWVAGQPAPDGILNRLFTEAWKWHKYLDTFTENALTWIGAHLFDGSAISNLGGGFPTARITVRPNSETYFLAYENETTLGLPRTRWWIADTGAMVRTYNAKWAEAALTWDYDDGGEDARKEEFYGTHVKLFERPAGGGDWADGDWTLRVEMASTNGVYAAGQSGQRGVYGVGGTGGRGVQGDGGTNAEGVVGQGNGTGAGVKGFAGTTGAGVEGSGAAGAPAVKAVGGNGTAALIANGGTNSRAVEATGNGTAAAISATGGATAPGIVASGGNGVAVDATGDVKSSTQCTAPHFYSTSSIPSLSVNAANTTGAGTGATGSISGSDMGGNITVATGAVPGAGVTYATVTFNVAWASAPKAVTVTPFNAAAWAAVSGGAVFATSVTTTGFTLVSTAALAALTSYQWTYQASP